MRKCLMVAACILAGHVICGVSARADMVYQLSFDDKDLKNAGSVGGEAVEDTTVRNLKFSSGGFVSDTPTGSGYAFALPNDEKQPNLGVGLALPDSGKRLCLDKAGDAMTAAMWVKLNKESEPRGDRTLLAKGQWAKDGWRFGLDKQRRLVFQYRPAAKPEVVNQRVSKDALPEGEWVHVALIVRTQGNKGIEFFINGEPAALDQGIGGVPLMPSDGPIAVGMMNADNGGALNGMIDDLRIYDAEIPIKELASQVQGLKR